MNINKEKLASFFKVIDENDIVSFDVFDTLLLRNLSMPKSVLFVMDNYVKNNTDAIFVYEGQEVPFSVMRMEAERIVRLTGVNTETTLDIIYEEMKRHTSNIDVEVLKKKELELESEFLTVNPFMKEVFNYALSKGKKIFIISDMYLPYDFIDSMLKKQGYKNYTFYLSCDYNLNKAYCGLYEYVCKEENLDKSKWIHIGDSIESDVINSQKCGIKSKHYKNVNSYTIRQETVAGDYVLEGIINNILYSGEYKLNYWEEFAIKYTFPIIYGYVHWLFSETKDNDNIFFGGRFGYLIKPIYDMLCKEYNVEISTKYLYVPLHVERNEDEILEYLVQEGVCDYEHVNVADMSDKSDLHRLIKKCRKNDQSCTGYYFITKDIEQVWGLPDRKGWHSDINKPVSNMLRIEQMFKDIEILFGRATCEVTGYVNDNLKLVPVVIENKSLKTIHATIRNMINYLSNRIIKYDKYIDMLTPDMCIAPYYELTTHTPKSHKKQFIKFKKKALKLT